MARLAWETELSLMSLGGQALVYLLGIVLARQLGVAGFESYVAASAVFVLMAGVAPQGLEKYTQKLVPTLLDRGDDTAIQEYLRLCVRRITLGSVLLGGVVALWAMHAPGMARETRVAIIVGCLSLPAGALVQLFLELLTAFGRGSYATRIVRLAVPSAVLLFAGVSVAWRPGMHAAWMIAAWGLGWAWALVLLARRVRRALPLGGREMASAVRTGEWVAGARPFWFYRVALAAQAQGGVVLLDALQPSASEVGGFAAALGTAAIAKVLATSTGRVYAARLSLLVARRDVAGMARLARERRRWLTLPLLTYGLVAFVFAPYLVGLFHPRFVQTGTAALRILIIAMVVTTALAMAPTCLKHLGQHRALIRSVVWAALLQLLLLVLLVPGSGATGAAIAYAVATAALYLRLTQLARLGVAGLKYGRETEGSPPGTAD